MHAYIRTYIHTNSATRNTELERITVQLLCADPGPNLEDCLCTWHRGQYDPISDMWMDNIKEECKRRKAAETQAKKGITGMWLEDVQPSAERARQRGFSWEETM